MKVYNFDPVVHVSSRALFTITSNIQGFKRITQLFYVNLINVEDLNHKRQYKCHFSVILSIQLLAKQIGNEKGRWEWL